MKIDVADLFVIPIFIYGLWSILIDLTNYIGSMK